MIREADTDGDGEINYDVLHLFVDDAYGKEFVHMILSK